MSITNNYDVCNLDLLYTANYQYSLPRKDLESFLKGTAFNNPPYTQEESKKLQDDINALYQRILLENPVKEKIAIITAGAPGAGKTTKLRQYLADQALEGKKYAYVCPDDVCLKNQTKTYLADIENGDQSAVARQNAYQKWRPGSNAATHAILGNLIREEYAFAFGTTSTSPFTGKSLEFYKNLGYNIKLIHVSAPDQVRWDSIKERDKTFIQTTEKDVKEKGQLLPQRINDTFLKYADEIEFYCRESVDQDAVLAARWIRKQDDQKPYGTLEIIAPSQYENIKTIHNKAVDALSRPDLRWENTVELSSQKL